MAAVGDDDVGAVVSTMNGREVDDDDEDDDRRDEQVVVQRTASGVRRLGRLANEDTSLHKARATIVYDSR